MCVVAGSILAVGCAAPKVKYREFTQQNLRTDISSYSDTYMLAKTAIDVTLSEDFETGDETFEVHLRRVEDSGRSFGMSPWSRYGVVTHVSIVKIDNTQLVQSASVSVEDNRIEYVAKAFKVVSSLSGLGLFGAAEEGGADSTRAIFPVSIDTQELLKSDKSCLRGACTLDTSESSHGINATLDVGEVPPDAIEVTELGAFLDSPQGVLFASACRQAKLEIEINNSRSNLVSNFSLADPRFVQVIRLPYKGTITAHSECGYSVVSEEVELVSDLDVADSVLSELKKLNEQLEEKGGE